MFFFIKIVTSRGGGNNGSKEILNKIHVYVNALSSIFGITLAKTGEESSKQGFVLTSISHGRKSASIIISRPKT